jgi:TRAP-type C4-dicarboxylate transport system substrate-binding protein
MNVKKMSLFVMGVVVAAMLLASCGGGSSTAGSTTQSAPDPRVLTYNMPPVTGAPPFDVAVNFLAPEALKRTTGKYTFEVYGGSSLSGNDMIAGFQMTQAGNIDCQLGTGVAMSAVVYKTTSISLPFAWNDMQTVYKTLNIGSPVSNRLNQILNENGLELLGYPPIGFRDITNSKREIRLPKDLSGLKMRVLANDMIYDLWRGWGVNTAFIDQSELYTSLQNGTIDGQENALVLQNVPQRIYEVNKFYTMINVAEDPFMMVMNKATWDNIPADDQKILRGLIDDYVAEARKLNDDLYEKDRKILLDNGVKITELTPDETAEWRKSAQPVIEKYTKLLDKELIDLVNAANGR